MKLAIAMFIVGGFSVAGYMYLKKHPDIMNQIMNLEKNMILDKGVE